MIWWTSFVELVLCLVAKYVLLMIPRSVRLVVMYWRRSNKDLVSALKDMCSHLMASAISARCNFVQSVSRSQQKGAKNANKTIL